MRDFVKVVILSPLAAAIFVALFHRLVREWELAGQMTTILTYVLMFGIWFLANFVANTVGGLVGSYMEEIQNTRSMSDFFMIFVISSFVAGLGLVLLNKKLRSWMHGVE